MAALIECPSGLHFHARKLRGSEANLFTDRKLVRQGKLIGKILGAVCEEIVDPGPYTIGQGGAPPWDQMLTGDRIVGLVQVRVATYKADMTFKVQCDNEGCRKRFDVDLNLEEDLVLKMLSDDDRNAFVNGNLLETFVQEDGAPQLDPALTGGLEITGRKVTFHLMTARDETKLGQVAERAPSQQITAALAQRVNDVDGVHANDLIRYFDKCDLDHIQDLVARMDEHDCGVDTDMEVECTHCGNFMEVQIPLGGREFFLPARRTAPAA
jgi:hypothetical protein